MWPRLNEQRVLSRLTAASVGRDENKRRDWLAAASGRHGGDDYDRATRSSSTCFSVCGNQADEFEADREWQRSDGYGDGGPVDCLGAGTSPQHRQCTTLDYGDES
jgi:hypothetical protein